MRILLSAVAATVAAAPVVAQSKSIVFCGRFPFVSFDSVNERAGGSITRLEEFDFSFVTPGPGAFAQSLQPATAHQAYLGDADADGNYTKFAGFKTYFTNIQVAGLFVKAADKAAVTADKVFFTVRDDVATHQIEVFTTNGTAVHVMRPGDFVRFLGNGNVEFFVTQDQIMAAAGPQTGTYANGASALCQDAQGNLYYSPAQGGHHVSGNAFLGGPVFANDGSIVMIDAASVTYDASGNVAAIAAGSAHVLWEEVGGGPLSGPSVRQMVTNANAMDRTGVLLPGSGGSAYANTVGLDLDPNGGTTQASYPIGDPPNHVAVNVPNFVFTMDNGSMAGTLVSTANNGSVATVNGVLCGSNTTGVPATGAHLGVLFDAANFQPTLMGFCIVDAVPPGLVLDTANFGALPVAAQQATWDLDVHGQPGQVVFLQVQLGPFAPGGFAPSVPSAVLPASLLAQPSHWQLFASVQSLGLTVTDGNGYGTWSFANPHTGPFAGATLLLQAVGLTTSQLQVSNPAQVQWK